MRGDVITALSAIVALAGLLGIAGCGIESVLDVDHGTRWIGLAALVVAVPGALFVLVWLFLEKIPRYAVVIVSISEPYGFFRRANGWTLYMCIAAAIASACAAAFHHVGAHLTCAGLWLALALGTLVLYAVHSMLIGKFPGIDYL
jgi:hypothetical protein